MKKIVIIGNGIAGITAARHIRKKSDFEITVISGESEFFFSRTALMYIYMGHMRFEHTKPYEDWFWKKNKISLIKDWVTSIDVNQKHVLLNEGDRLAYDDLILATGSSVRKFGWPGQELKGVSGLYSLQDLEYIEEHTTGIKRATIVGGGLIGIELVEMLHSRGIEVTFLVRENSFWNTVLPEQESKMINTQIEEHGIDLRLSTELAEIISDEVGHVKSILTSSGEEIPAEFVGLTAGVKPNISLVQDLEVETDIGILVDDTLRTNVPDIYAIGDCAQLRNPLKHRRAVEAVWYAGRMMGETVAKTVCSESSVYRPGVWFNSAKFFNVEYQTYGVVSAQIKEGEEHFIWQSAYEKKSMRIVFDANERNVIGMITMGIRARHEIWDHWISNRAEIIEVIENLERANFDPEFFKKYEKEIRQHFHEQYSGYRAV